MIGARLIWAVASPVKKFLLGVVPFTTIWDVLHFNLLDLAAGVIVFCWIIYDIQQDLARADRHWVDTLIPSKEDDRG